MDIIRYMLKKLLFAMIVIYLVVTVTFILMHLLPGKPFSSDRIMDTRLYDNLMEQYGLKKPLVIQYGLYLRNVATGDFGLSMVYTNKSVNEMLARSLPISLDLGVRAFVVAMVMGILLGLFTSRYQSKVLNRLMLMLIVLLVSIPSFIMGALSQYLVCYRLSAFLRQTFSLDYNPFPLSGWGDFSQTVVPVTALAIGAFAMIAKLMQESAKEVLQQNYILTARAKGLSKWKTTFRHVLRNASLPVLSTAGPLLSGLIMGSLVIESLFSIPGIGQMLVTCIKEKDYTMVLGLSIVTAIIIVAANLLFDMLICLIDPRVRMLRNGK